MSNDQDQIINITEAAALLGVCTETLRQWEKEGKLKPCHRTAGGHRRYLRSEINPVEIIPINLLIAKSFLEMANRQALINLLLADCRMQLEAWFDGKR